MQIGLFIDVTMKTRIQLDPDGECASDFHQQFPFALTKMQETLDRFRKNKLEELKKDIALNERWVNDSKSKFWILEIKSEALLECSKRMHQSHLNSVLHSDSSAVVTHDIEKSLAPKDNVTFQHCINTSNHHSTH